MATEAFINGRLDRCHWHSMARDHPRPGHGAMTTDQAVSNVADSKHAPGSEWSKSKHFNKPLKYFYTHSQHVIRRDMVWPRSHQYDCDSL